MRATTTVRLESPNTHYGSGQRQWKSGSASPLTTALSFLKSVHMRTLPDFFMTGTIGEHQSVGSVTSSMIPAVFILSSSCLTLSTRGMVILRAVCRLYGLAPSSRTFFTGEQSAGRSSSSLNSWPMVSVLLTKPIPSAASLLSRLSAFMFTTKSRTNRELWMGPFRVLTALRS